MRFTLPVRIAIGAISLFVLLQGLRTLQGASKEPIKTQKDPNITASEQYAFVECKRKSGEYKDYHHEDMMGVLNAYGIPESILQTQKVKDLVKRQIENGGCDFYSAYDRIKDMVSKIQGAGGTYRKLSGWRLYTINMYAEAECMISTGELSTRQEQEKLIGEKITENESLFEGVDEEQFTRFVKENVSTMVWLTQQKKSQRDCSYKPST